MQIGLRGIAMNKTASFDVADLARLAIVNDMDGFIPTDFNLGGRVYQIEAVFLRRFDDTPTGDVFVGAFTNGDDYDDLRLFFSGENMFLDYGFAYEEHGWRISGYCPTDMWNRIIGPIQYEWGGTYALFNREEKFRYDDYLQPVGSKTLNFFSSHESGNKQRGALRYVHIKDFETGNLCASFYPYAKGSESGVIDVVSGKFYPAVGEGVRIVPWTQLSTTEAWVEV